MTSKVAVITGATSGIGAGLVAGYRGRGWAVVVTDGSIRPSTDPDVLTVAGDLAEPETADRVIGGALDRFGRIDTLVVAGHGLAGFFWLTQRAIAEMAIRYGGHVVTVLATGDLVAATRSLAAEYAVYGIRVNAVRPSGRPGQIGGVVEGVLFLESAPGITGEILHLDGGPAAGSSGHVP